MAEDEDLGAAEEAGEVTDEIRGAIDDDGEVDGGEMLIGEAIDEAATAFDATGDGGGEGLGVLFLAE